MKQQPKSSRLVVARLQPGGQAAKLGLRARDVFVSYDGQPVTTRNELLKAKSKVTGDATAKVVVKRGNEQIEFVFKSGPLGFIPAEAQSYDALVFE